MSGRSQSTRGGGPNLSGDNTPIAGQKKENFKWKFWQKQREHLLLITWEKKLEAF
jgi:hypothetical protein